MEIGDLTISWRSSHLLSVLWRDIRDRWRPVFLIVFVARNITSALILLEARSIAISTRKFNWRATLRAPQIAWVIHVSCVLVFEIRLGRSFLQPLSRFSRIFVLRGTRISVSASSTAGVSAFLVSMSQGDIFASSAIVFRRYLGVELLFSAAALAIPSPCAYDRTDQHKNIEMWSDITCVLPVL